MLKSPWDHPRPPGLTPELTPGGVRARCTVGKLSLRSAREAMEFLTKFQIAFLPKIMSLKMKTPQFEQVENHDHILKHLLPLPKQVWDVQNLEQVDELLNISE